MIKTEEYSNAQTWELEIVCKNKKYLKKVVKAILKIGVLEFEVNIVDGYIDRFTVLIWCCWFSNFLSRFWFIYWRGR